MKTAVLYQGRGTVGLYLVDGPKPQYDGYITTVDDMMGDLFPGGTSLSIKLVDLREFADAIRDGYYVVKYTYCPVKSRLVSVE
jgi:hypothetical protein